MPKSARLPKWLAKWLACIWPSCAATAVVSTACVALYPRLPEMLPTHFDIHGTPDTFSGKFFVVMLFPTLSLGAALLMPLLVQISPQGFRMENSASALQRMSLSLGMLFNGLELGIVLHALDPERFQMSAFFCGAIGLFLVLFGSTLGKTERNFILGIRTPWSITSPKNWQATHRFAQRTMTIAGLAVLLLAFLSPNFKAAFLLLLIGALSPVLYSLIYFRQHEGRK